ncbi:TPA: DUF4263 domain-containing protein [Legionella pneumophila]|uniref:Shedu anti-phage system protein SduA domain-containing protein n=1 Tax=Legionella pneumophila TaxID=446 RepID=UPI000D04C282|nr:Shedu anti-phage system protein SduA domain-containing protein [Legionella pneumophila]HAU0774880.1 DUF4263 domain-containing protein [Legionella pneumophila]HDV4553825.1 DUF4263 domain-containing protein [Legionella pneumophila]
MPEIVKVKSVSRDFAKTNGVLLEETSTTALVFFPEIHPGGVRGHLVRLKKKKGEPWEKIPEQDFKKLQLYEGVHIELGTEQITKLCDEIAKRKPIASQLPIGQATYRVSTDEDNLNGVITQLVNQGQLPALLEMLEDSDPNTADKLTAGLIQLRRKKIIEELKYRLTQSYHETKGEDSWQRWIYENCWIFGANYQQPIEKTKINISGIMPDYLFPTMDNFVDVLEIKLPTFSVIEADPNHKGSWVWSKESNYAIGQVVTYLGEIERQRLELERSIKQYHQIEIFMLKPRAYILIGRSDDWTAEKKEGLKKLNYHLHGIEVLTYSDLLKRGEAFLHFPQN